MINHVRSSQYSKVGADYFVSVLFSEDSVVDFNSIKVYVVREICCTLYFVVYRVRTFYCQSMCGVSCKRQRFFYLLFC